MAGPVPLRVILVLCLLFRLSHPGLGQTRTRHNLGEILGFESGTPGQPPAGWSASPANTAFIDAAVAHGGSQSARIERDSSSASQGSFLTVSIPLNFVAARVELRGFLKTEGVEGVAALWMRQDGVTPSLAFVSNQNPGVRGTTDWREYSITFPVVRATTNLFLGVLLTGAGKVWADDLQLLAGGTPVAAAPDIMSMTSGVTLHDLSPVQIDNLVKLARIWGFLKYHHPAVTGGQREWDYDLFRVLPKIAAADSSSVNQVLNDWVSELGTVPDCTPCATLDTADLQRAPALDWLAGEAVLGAELSQTLQAIHRNRSATGGGFYATSNPTSPAPSFENEARYPAAALPDSGHQLLALFRFWNVVEYFHPNRNDLPDWDTVLRESIPAFAVAESRAVYEQELLKLTASVRDTNTRIENSDLLPPQGPCQCATGIRFLDGIPRVSHFLMSTVSPLTPTPSDRVFNLTLGTPIDILDGIPIARRIEQWRPFFSASNEAVLEREIAKVMLRGPCVNAIVGAIGLPERRFSPATLDFNANLAHDRPGDVFQKLSNEVAYLKLGAAETARVPGYLQSAAGTASLIIDLRNTPAESFATSLAAHLIAAPVEFMRLSKADPANPGAFHWQPPLRIAPREPRYTGKIVVLVDELTQGPGEITALALQAVPGAVILGGSTAGGPSATTAVPLPGALTALISATGVSYPNGDPTHRLGVVPSAVIKPSFDVFTRGRDQFMEEALLRTIGRPALSPTAPGPLTAVLGPETGMDFVDIKPGEFLMGCSPGDPTCALDERPPIRVRITKTFQMAKYELTQDQWYAVMGGGSPTYKAPPGLPRFRLRFIDIPSFLEALNRRDDGFYYRLPTEAEWEYAARAGNPSPAYGKLDEIAWYRVNTPGTLSLQPVGKKQPNDWGLYDMLGNVSELVQDFYSAYSEHTDPPLTDPRGISTSWPSGGYKILRGGYIYHGNPRASTRVTIAPNLLAPNCCGFRVVRERLDGGVTPYLSELLVWANSIPSQGSLKATIRLTSWALRGGTPITVESSNPAVIQPLPTVTVPAARDSVDFTLTARSVTVSQPVTITVRLGAQTRTARLTVIPQPPSAEGALGMRFVEAPPGEFMRGCSFDDFCWNVGRNYVRLTRPFEIATHEVTQAQWETIMAGVNPSPTKGPSLPVFNVGWEAAQEFLARLTARGDGYRYRLPTDAEWEYAARAGTTDSFLGSELKEMAVDPSQGFQPVGTKKPNAWGLYDVLGNAHELVASDWLPGTYPSTLVIDPQPPANFEKGVRGLHDVLHLRAGLFPSIQERTGLRIVREKNPQ